MQTEESTQNSNRNPTREIRTEYRIWLKEKPRVNGRLASIFEGYDWSRVYGELYAVFIGTKWFNKVMSPKELAIIGGITDEDSEKRFRSMAASY